MQPEPYVILRGTRSGVHAGFLVARDEHGMYVLRSARRIWRWVGAATLSDLAMFGAASPNECKFSSPADRTEIARDDVCEVIHCATSGQRMIEECPLWAV
jgi:hypothetical protein